LLVLVPACAFHEGHALELPSDARQIDASSDAAPDATPDAPYAPFAMSGQLWHLPCLDYAGNYNCHCVTGAQDQTVMIAGTGRWMVTVRIRGVMEAMGYGGGTAGSGGWYAGGTPNDTANNYYELKVSNPNSHFYLNRGTPTGQQSFAYDYTASFEVDGGATITYEANGQDGLQWGNWGPTHMPFTIPGVMTTPDPYDGQFAQLDVISAAPM